MLHTKFRGNRPAGSGEEDFLKDFYHIWAWRPFASCDSDAAKKVSIPFPKEAPHEIWRFLRRRMFEHCGRRTDDDDDGRTSDHG